MAATFLVSEHLLAITSSTQFGTGGGAMCYQGVQYARAGGDDPAVASPPTESLPFANVIFANAQGTLSSVMAFPIHDVAASARTAAGIPQYRRPRFPRSV